MSEGGIDYREIIHRLLKGEIRVMKEIRTCGNAGERK